MNRSTKADKMLLEQAYMSIYEKKNDDEADINEDEDETVEEQKKDGQTEGEELETALEIGDSIEDMKKQGKKLSPKHNQLQSIAKKKINDVAHELKSND